MGASQALCQATAQQRRDPRPALAVAFVITWIERGSHPSRQPPASGTRVRKVLGWMPGPASFRSTTHARVQAAARIPACLHQNCLAPALLYPFSMSFDPHAQRPGGAPQRACVAVGLELPAPGTRAVSGTVSVEEAGRLLRCSEATVRRLIRTTVLRRVGVGEHHVRRSDVESYRQSLLRPRGEHQATVVW
jgi:hypothetical protein